MQKAFTNRYNGLTRVLHTQIGVCLPFAKEEAQQVKINKYLAIWDTGATHSAITKKVADELNLKPTGIVEVRYGSGKAQTNTYLVNIALPDNVMVGNVRVTEVNLIPDDNTQDHQQPQLLIGMDIITLGDFAVTNANGKTVFSFRIPSIQEIDFVPEIKENNILKYGNHQARRAMKAMLRKKSG